MKKRISLVGPEVQKKLRAGVKFLNNRTKVTLGPYGRNFASGVRGGPIHISNDGVSLAKELEGLDEFEDIGLRAAREAATKTNDEVGDGTTTAIALTEALFDAIPFDADIVAVKSAVELSEQVRVESEEVVEKLNKMALPVQTREQLIDIARVSVENKDLAELIGGAQWDVGPEGTVLAETHNQSTDKVEKVFGIRWDNGFSSSRFMTNPEKQALELEKVHVLITDKVFNSVQSLTLLQPLWQQLHAQGSVALVIIARAFDETAINFCLKNMQALMDGKASYGLWPINAPYTDQDNIMEDIAAVTGGKYIKAAGRNMESVILGDIGFASKLTVKRFEGTIIGKAPGEDPHIDSRVADRIEHIRKELEGQVSPFERRGLESRLSQLITGTAIVYVGAETEQERIYKKDKADDAVNTVKAAFQDGVVPGAGQAFMNIADTMPEALIYEALKAPYQQIMKNAGRTFEVAQWVQDPVKVVRTAFQKASSIARSLATTEVLTNWEREKPQFVQAVEKPEEGVE